MSKRWQVVIPVSEELWKAIDEVSVAEDMSKADLIRPILEDVFLPKEDKKIIYIKPRVEFELGVIEGKRQVYEQTLREAA